MPPCASFFPVLPCLHAWTQSARAVHSGPCAVHFGQVWASKIYDNVFLRCEHFLQGPTPHDRREMPPYALQLLQQPYAYRKRVGAIHSTYTTGRWKSAGAYVIDGVHDECAAVPHPSEKRQWC